MKKLLSFALILIFYSFFISCDNNQSNGTNSEVDETAYELVSLEVGEIESYLEESGELTPRSITKIKYSLTGQILSLYKEQGDQVYKGENLAKVKPDIDQVQDITSAQIEYQKNLNALKVASNELVSAEELYEEGLVSKISYEELYDEYLIAEAEVEQTLLELQALRESGDIDNVEAVYVKATASGTIYARDVEVGDYVLAASPYQDGTVIYEIADISDMIIEAQINEIDILNIEKEAEVEITISALPDEDFIGEVYRIFPSPEEDEDVKKYTVQVELVSELPKNIMPGMTVQIKVQTIYETNINILPLGCVVRDSDTKEDYVLVPDDSGKTFTKQTVTTGVRNYDYIEIESGLEIEDQVAKNPYLVPEEAINNEEVTDTEVEEVSYRSRSFGSSRRRHS